MEAVDVYYVRQQLVLQPVISAAWNKNLCKRTKDDNVVNRDRESDWVEC